MYIYNSKQWMADLDEVVNSLPELNALEGSTVLITGSTGLVCSPVVDILNWWNETHQGGIKLLVAGRSETKIKKRFGPYAQKNWFRYVPYDAAYYTDRLNIPCDYIIHGASNSSPDMIIREPVETIMSNVIGVKLLLDNIYANNGKRLLYISSSEVYGKKAGIKPFGLNEYGYIDLLKSRNSYSIGKRAAETLCASYFDEYSVDSVIIRPGHIYGPTATVSDKHVSSLWAYSAAKGEDIIMKSNGAQIRSYCYCLDSASAIITVLVKGESVHAYNISNPESIITIRKMAEIITKYSGVSLKLDLPNDAEIKSFNPMSNSSLDSSELLNLGWKGLFDAERGFAHTIEILKELF